jgi:hypothetical protein
MDNTQITDVVLKKANQAKTLAYLTNEVIVADKRLPVDCTVLFSRLVLNMQREKIIEPVFQHELAATPTAFFNGFSMRKTSKSDLAKHITASVAKTATLPVSTVYVVDGGWLLHKVKWRMGGTYAEADDCYLRYVSSSFGKHVIIVFDGYLNGPTVKDHEYDRRALKACPDIVLDDGKPVFGDPAAFLANESNKKEFGDMLMKGFITNRYKIHQTRCDVDTLITKSA